MALRGSLLYEPNLITVRHVRLEVSLLSVSDDNKFILHFVTSATMSHLLVTYLIDQSNTEARYQIAIIFISRTITRINAWKLAR